MEATAGRRVCGVLELIGPPRLITIVGTRCIRFAKLTTVTTQK